jgi:hypothetical protein
MIKANEQINLTGTEIIDVLKEIEIILTSLHKMGSYYAIKHHEGKLDKDNGEYEKETTRFIDEWKVTHRLAKIRCVLSEKFDNALGVDDMDDLERAMEGLKYWEKPGDQANDNKE